MVEETTTEANPKIDHFEDVDSLDEANQVLWEQEMALRIQPRAPAPTRYYFVGTNGYRRQECGQRRSVSVDVEAVREAVKRATPKNSRNGGGGVKAVEKSQITEYVN